MFNSALYTGTGIAVAGLSAAYYVYASRINVNANHFHPALDHSVEEDSSDDDSVSASAREHEQELREPPDEYDFFTSADSGGATSYLSDADSTCSDGHSFHSCRSKSRPFTAVHSTQKNMSASSQRILKTSLDNLNSGNGSKNGLNIAQDNVHMHKRTSSSIGVPLRLTHAQDSLRTLDVKQIVSRAEITSSASNLNRNPSSSRNLARESITEEDEDDANSSPADVNSPRPTFSGAGGDHASIKKAEAEVSGSKLLKTPAAPALVLDEHSELVPPVTGTTMSDCVSETDIDAEENVIPLHSTDSPIIFYTNPRFGSLGACEDTERSTVSAILKSSIMSTTQDSGSTAAHAGQSPSPSKIPRRIAKAAKSHLSTTSAKKSRKSKIPGKCLSESESFQQILQDKRKHLRPVGERKSEGMIPELHHQRDASVQADPSELELEHTDSTVILFPPVFSESNMSTTETSLLNVAQTDEFILLDEIDTIPGHGQVTIIAEEAMPNSFDFNNNEGREQVRQVEGSMNLALSSSRGHKRKFCWDSGGEPLSSADAVNRPAPAKRVSHNSWAIGILGLVVLGALWASGAGLPILWGMVSFFCMIQVMWFIFPTPATTDSD